MTATQVRSGPVPDEDSRPYWDALVEHRILLQTCQTCGRVRCPPLPACGSCGGTAAVTSYASGDGAVYSWIRIHRSLGSISAAEVPCSIVTVELEEGCRLVGRLTSDDAPAIGAPVTATFVTHADWIELTFTPCGDGS
jgi:uncharacterized OB-fold protein